MQVANNYPEIKACSFENITCLLDLVPKKKIYNCQNNQGSHQEGTEYSRLTSYF